MLPIPFHRLPNNGLLAAGAGRMLPKMDKRAIDRHHPPCVAFGALPDLVWLDLAQSRLLCGLLLKFFGGLAPLVLIAAVAGRDRVLVVILAALA